jgi:hypothetical protein
MNDFQLFEDFGAVVEIRKNYKDDLYNFIKLILNLGFMNEEITTFINVMELLEKFENGKWEKIRLENNLTLTEKMELLDEWFTDENFWHFIEINNGIRNRICIEYQKYKGFTFGDKEEYLKYDNTIKILSVEDLIKACNKEDIFNMNYVETSFLEELKDEKDKDLAIWLTDFCEWYEWQLVKYPNGLYNILDVQAEELVGNFKNDNGNGNLRDCIERVFFRMVDYFTDEGEHEEIEYVEKEINMFKKLGKQYNLYKDDDIKWLDNWLKEELEYLGGNSNE